MKKRKKEKERKKKRESPPCVCKSAGKREITLKNTIFYTQKSKDEKTIKVLLLSINFGTLFLVLSLCFVFGEYHFFFSSISIRFLYNPLDVRNNLTDKRADRHPHIQTDREIKFGGPYIHLG